MIFNNTLFKDKVALVTGGGSGIGKHIAQQLLQTGARVYITGRKIDKLEKASEALGVFGPVHYRSCDIREPDQIQELASQIKEEAGQLDVLINNAGGQFPAMAEHISENGWRAVINNNLNGTFYMTRAMANTFFIPQKSGVIINIIVNIYRGFPGMAHTGAARAGVDNLTKTLAVEWSKHNIRVNAIAPGLIQSTGMDNYPPELVKGLADTIPWKRLGTTEEVAYLTLFMASPVADYITGETVYIDGGQRLYGQQFQI